MVNLWGKSKEKLWSVFQAKGGRGWKNYWEVAHIEKGVFPQIAGFSHKGGVVFQGFATRKRPKLNQGGLGVVHISTPPITTATKLI